MAQTIPTGWEEKTLGEICVIIAGQSPNSQFYNTEANGLPFYQGKKEFTNKYIGTPSVWTTETTKEALPGDILMSVRAPVGPINYATERCCIGRGLASIRNGELISKDFLFYYLLSIQQKIGGHNGAVFNSISRNEISALKILLPSLSEQERIVAKLDKAFEAIDKVKANAEQNLNNAKELFESALNRFFTENTEGWEEKKLDDVCTYKSGTTISKDLEKDTGDLLYIKVGDMNIRGNEELITTSTRFASSAEISAAQIIPTGSVIFPKRGGAIATNKKRKIIKPTIVDLNTMAIIPNKELDSNFFYYWFGQINLIDISNGTTIPQINNYSFQNLRIKYPTLLEQQKIVEQLDKIQEKTKKLEAIYTKKIKECDELKQSILQKAFRGEL